MDGCDSCQQLKPSTQQPYGTLEPLPILAGTWNDISYYLITDLPVSNGCDSILTTIDRITKMFHFTPCSMMNANQLANLLIRHVWKLHGTPKTIFSNQGSIFISRITKVLSQKPGIKLHPLTAYHPCTDGQSEIANKVLEKYLRHYIHDKKT